MNINSPKKKERWRDREKAGRRQAMLEAAERVFASKGFREATIGEIGREAGFAVGTFYNFFKDKEDLYAQVLDGIAAEFMEAFEREVQSLPNALDALGALVELRLRIFEQHRGFFRFFFEQPIVGMSQGLTQRHLQLRERYRDAQKELFIRGIDDGVFEDEDPLFLAVCLDGMLNAFVRFNTTREQADGEPLSERNEKIKTTILNRFRRKT